MMDFDDLADIAAYLCWTAAWLAAAAARTWMRDVDLAAQLLHDRAGLPGLGPRLSLRKAN